jgi:hypothetical protein
MITIVANFARPSLNVEFFSMPTEFKDEFMTKYRYTGKSTSTTASIAEDGLTATATTVWRTRTDFTDFLQDPLSDTMRTARAAYCEANGITLEVVPTFTPSEGDPAEDVSSTTPVVQG